MELNYTTTDMWRLFNSGAPQEVHADNYTLGSGSEIYGRVMNYSVPPNIEKLALATWWIYSCLAPIVVIAGLVGNTLNLLVLWCSKDLANVPYAYLRALAVSDFCEMPLFVAFLVLNLCVHHTDTTLYIAKYMAHVHLFVFNSFACVSNLLVMVVTVDRWWAICHPLHALYWRSAKVVTATVTSIYIMSFVLHIPECFQYEVTRVQDRQTLKVYYTHSWITELHDNVWYSHVWPWVTAIISKILPLTSVVLLNPLILRAYRTGLKTRKTLSQTMSDIKEQRQRADERHLTVLLITLSCVFITCIIPVTVLTLVDKMVAQERLERNVPYQIFRHVSNLLEVVNMAINFYLYNVSNSSFRAACRGVLPHHCRSRRHRKSFRLSEVSSSTSRGSSHYTRSTSTSTSASTSVSSGEKVNTALMLRQYTGLETLPSVPQRFRTRACLENIHFSERI